MEVKENQNTIKEYGNYIFELQNQVEQLKSQLTTQKRDHEEIFQKKVHEMMSQQSQRTLLQDQKMKSDFWTRSSFDLRKDSDFYETDLSNPNILNQEEELIYTHLQNESGKQSNLLGAQLSEAYERLVKNFDEEADIKR